MSYESDIYANIARYQTHVIFIIYLLITVYRLYNGILNLADSVIISIFLSMELIVVAIWAFEYRISKQISNEFAKLQIAKRV